MLEEIKSWFHSGAKVDTQLLTSNISISTQNVWKLETHFNKRIACKCLVVIILMRLNVAENFSKIQDLDYETPFAPEFWCIPWSTKGFSLFSAYLNQENLALFTSTLRWNHFTLFVVHLHIPLPCWKRSCQCCCCCCQRFNFVKHVGMCLSAACINSND